MLKKLLGVNLCIVIAAAIVTVTGLAYHYVDHSWVFAPEISQAAVGALSGVNSRAMTGWAYSQTPIGVRTKANGQPETAMYAAEYPIYGDNHLSTDISDDIADGGVPLLLQWDKRWGYRLYGTNFMGNNGCGPTALAIVYAGLTGKSDWDPYSIAMYSIDQGLYYPNRGTFLELMSKGGKHLGLKVYEYGKKEKDIKKGLEKGQLMICHVVSGDFTTGGHFIVLTGMTYDGQVEIRDPNSAERSQQLWDFERIMEQTTTVWGYAVK